MSDYREITLADAIKRIAYIYGEAHCDNTAAENESTRDTYEPNDGKAYDELIDDVPDLFAGHESEVMTGIADAIRDSQPVNTFENQVHELCVSVENLAVEFGEYAASVGYDYYGDQSTEVAQVVNGLWNVLGVLQNARYHAKNDGL